MEKKPTIESLDAIVSFTVAIGGKLAEHIYTAECDGCDKKFMPSDIRAYRGKHLCPRCLDRAIGRHLNTRHEKFMRRLNFLNDDIEAKIDRTIEAWHDDGCDS